MNIPKYVLIKSEANGFDFYYYLHINGGSGTWGDGKDSSLGGRYNFCLYYADPDEQKIIVEIDPRFSCKELKIPFGVGETIEAAYKAYLKSMQANKRWAKTAKYHDQLPSVDTNNSRPKI